MRFLQNLAWGKESPLHTLTSNFIVVALKKYGSTAPPNRQNWYFFGINFPKMGILPYAIFTKFGLGKGVPDPHPHAKFYRCGFKNVGL